MAGMLEEVRVAVMENGLIDKDSARWPRGPQIRTDINDHSLPMRISQAIDIASNRAQEEAAMAKALQSGVDALHDLRRLVTLITEWADACDAWDGKASSIDESANEAAATANLRKAVGR
jgi:hypothetical protein